MLGYWLLFSRFTVPTDNAYVMGNQIPVHAQTSGGISSIYGDDNDLILQNDVITTIESVDAKNNFEYAKNSLAKTI